MQRNLSFEQAPPIAVPLRFFLTAPLFGMAAGVLMLVAGPAVFASRWAPVTLALTHLLTIGFVALVMCGALMQMLPVLAGAVMPRPVLVSRAVHGLLVAGTIVMSWSFLRPTPALFGLTGVLLGSGFALFAGTVLYALSRARASGETVLAMRLAVLALVVTVVLGLVLVSAFASAAVSMSLIGITNVHLAWGILGWTGLLVAGVAFQVVPMFQVTPSYPGWMTRNLIPILFAVLGLWSLARLLPAGTGHIVAELLLGINALAFAALALVTLNLQRKRRRKLPDVTRDFWMVGMISVLAATGLWIAGTLAPGLRADRAVAFLLGALLLIGFAASVINGMLYKIVPFLVWFHLQQRSMASRGAGAAPVPNVKQIIPAAPMHRQFRLHTVALAAVTGACVWPRWLAPPAGALLAVSFLLLWINLLRAVSVFSRGQRP